MIKGLIKISAAAAAVGAGIYGGIKFAKGVAWFKDYSKLVPYEVKSVKDSSLTDEDDYVLIAHRGFRAVAPENTLPAYEEAGKAGYWGAECDIYRTRDGVWIVHHDPVTTRMMDKSRSLELSTYDELLNLNYTNGHNIDKYPNLKICTLEDYFKTCAKYGMKCIVEIKYNRNRQYYYEIIDLQKKYGVEANYIAFSFEDIIDLRKITDAPLYLLVDEIKDEDIEKAKTVIDCGISYHCNNELNTANDCERIKKVHEAGLKTATWTCDSLDIMEKVVRAGTRYITTNCITY